MIERAILEHGAELAWSDGPFGGDAGLGDVVGSVREDTRRRSEPRLAHEKMPQGPGQNIIAPLA